MLLFIFFKRINIELVFNNNTIIYNNNLKNNIKEIQKDEKKILLTIDKVYTPYLDLSKIKEFFLFIFLN